MANYALKILSEVALNENGQEIPLRPPTDILFHRNDPLPILQTTEERGTDIDADSKRIPHIVLTSKSAAQRVGEKPYNRWDDIAFMAARRKPKLPFTWPEIHGCGEFELEEEILAPLPKEAFTTGINVAIDPQAVPKTTFPPGANSVSGSSTSFNPAGQSETTPRKLLKEEMLLPEDSFCLAL